MGTATSLFGEHLRREREMRGVSLEEISAATRISVKFLEALENEQWEQLPGGIFNRGFIRSIAKFLGMDEDGLVAEYAMETQERPEIAVWTKEPVKPRPNWLGIIGAVVVIAAVIAGGWCVHRAYGERISAWHARHSIVATVMAKLRRKGAASAAVASANPPKAVNGSTASPNSDWPAAAQGAQNGAAGTAGGGAATSSSGAIPANRAASADASDAAELVLKVEAGETSTVAVTADGKTVFSGTLDALKTLTLRAQKSFTVSSSKSNAVLLELNGRTVPPLGPPNEPGKITLTRENLKRNPGDGYY